MHLATTACLNIFDYFVKGFERLCDRRWTDRNDAKGARKPILKWKRWKVFIACLPVFESSISRGSWCRQHISRAVRDLILKLFNITSGGIKLIHVQQYASYYV